MWHLTSTVQATVKEGDFGREDGEQTVWTVDSWNQMTPLQGRVIFLFSVKAADSSSEGLPPWSTLSPAEGGSRREQWPFKSLKQLKSKKHHRVISYSYSQLLIQHLLLVTVEVHRCCVALRIYLPCFIFLLVISSLNEYTRADFSRPDLKIMPHFTEIPVVKYFSIYF